MRFLRIKLFTVISCHFWWHVKFKKCDLLWCHKSGINIGTLYVSTVIHVPVHTLKQIVLKIWLCWVVISFAWTLSYNNLFCVKRCIHCTVLQEVLALRKFCVLHNSCTMNYYSQFFLRSESGHEFQLFPAKKLGLIYLAGIPIRSLVFGSKQLELMS